MRYIHTPAMLKEVLEYLKPGEGGNFIDCTLGGGGYSQAILAKVGARGKVLGIDLDDLAVINAKKNIKAQNLVLAQGNFKNLNQIVQEHFKNILPLSGRSQFDGIVFDLGLSSAQLNDQSRGFSFNLTDSPLGMNFGSIVGVTAEEIINRWSLEDLAGIFKDYGEEKFAYRIAQAIVRERRIKEINTTGRLVEVILSATPKISKNYQGEGGRRPKIHPATKVFQALRITVNEELENLRAALPQAISLLKTGGRLVVVSYHSLEDRIVKQFFKQESRDCLCPPESPICRCGHLAKLKILLRGVLRPSDEEIASNPRARSAKLRAAEKI